MFFSYSFLYANNINQIECKRIMDYLCDKYGLTCSLHKTSKGFNRIYIKTISFSTLRNLVMPHMHPSMIYKITK